MIVNKRPGRENVIGSLINTHISPAKDISRKKTEELLVEVKVMQTGRRNMRANAGQACQWHAFGCIPY